jgi:hypothetical protein
MPADLASGLFENEQEGHAAAGVVARCGVSSEETVVFKPGVKLPMPR